MKRPLSLLLALSLLLPLRPAALGAEAAPAAPGWVEPEDYITFPGDPVYQPENWQTVLSLRQEAASGGLLPQEGRDWAEGSPGQCYETALIRRRCAENYTDEGEARLAFLAAGRAFGAAESGLYDQNRGRDETYYRVSIEKYRSYLVYHPDYIADWGRGLVPALDALELTLEDFFDAPYMDRVGPEAREKVTVSVNAYWDFYIGEKSRLTVYLDGTLLQMDTQPQVRNQRTMAPVRALAEALGADVAWDPDTWQVTMTRAGSTLTMTPGDPTAWVDGTPVEMDVAPYADQNRTYFPVRYAAELFGQEVTWNAAQRRVDIAEPRQEEREAPLLAMGALLGFLENGEPGRFGFYPRAPHLALERNEYGVPESRPLQPARRCRELLAQSWAVESRVELYQVVEDLLSGGHDREFQAAAKEVKTLSDREIARLAGKLGETDQYMWPRTKALWKKWGETGIRAWDLCRAAAIVQWGYTAGYVTYSEALALLEPAVAELQEAFTTWDQVYENFLEGYYWCLRQDLGEDTVWDTDLGAGYLYLKNSPETRTLFNDELLEASPSKP